MNYKLEFVIACFERVYGLTDVLPLITYAETGVGPVVIQPNDEMTFEKLQPITSSSVVWRKWRDQRVPLLFCKENEDILTHTQGVVRINFDLIAATFYFLSGWQEVAGGRRDEFGRFTYAGSLQDELACVGLPVVDIYFDIFKTAIEIATGRKIRSSLWGEAPFAICLTHDIDKCESAWLEGSFRELLAGEVTAPFGLVARKLAGRDAWFNFEKILQIEREFEAHASFYFLARKGKRNGQMNADYDITKSKFQRVFNKIEAAGSECGLHASFGTHDSLANFSSDLRRLNRNCTGSRYHFLQFDMQVTPKVLQEAGMAYDTSLGFSEHIGFRNGTSFPFFLFDHGEKKRLDVVEIPLHVMDATLQFPNYMGLTPDVARSRIDHLLDAVRDTGGCLTVLWHNTHFSDYKYGGWREVFLHILRRGREQGAVFLSGREVLAAYRGM